MRFSDSESFNTQLTRFCGELCGYGFVRAESAGYSVGGREIKCLHIGGKDKVFLLAGTHPQEYITVALACEWLGGLCEAIHKKKPFLGFDVYKVFERRGVSAVLCHNPDGTEIAFGGDALSGAELESLQEICKGDARLFNCNLSGVDLNHNFDAGWESIRRLETAAGITGPAPRGYGGPSVCSEPENRAVVSLCEKHNFRQALALHSQGEEIYWRYGDSTPDYSEIMAHMLSISCKYRLAAQTGLASHGGFKDWFISRFNRPAFTVELGKGQNPLPLSDLPAIYKKTAKMLLVFCLM